MGESIEVLKIETFGGLAIRLSERRLSGFASRKAEALLVYLAFNGQAVPRSVLANLFWEEASERRAATNLRVVLSSLRKQLDPYLEIDRQTVRFGPSKQVWLDTLALERRLADGDLEKGLALYHGEFLEGFHLRNCRTFERWQTTTREHYLRRIRESLHEGVRQGMARQDLKTGLRYARRLLDLDPFDEVALRRMLELLARTGQRNAAVRLFERYENIYAQELGVAPDPVTWALFDRIRVGDLPPDPATRRPRPGTSAAAQPAPEVGLPESLTPFVGRARELAAVETLLADPDVRLVSILGPGGSGKTRLCLEIGRRETPRFADGIYFIPLISIHEPEAIVSAVASAFGVQPEESRQQKQQLLNLLASRELLMIFDNFETVLEGAPIAAEILQHAAGVKVITTSREKLNLPGEHVYRLGGLDCGREGAEPESELPDSSRLFLQTARRLNPKIKGGPGVDHEVARICRLVEGLPLAIELAAAWTDTLSLQEIANRIETGLDILDVEQGGLPARHHSIRLVFDATFQSLDSAAQSCFSALSVFHGSCSGRAAQVVAGATIGLLKALVRKSLLSLQDDGRYHVHELLKQYGAEKLAASPQSESAIKTRHSRYYVDFLAGVEKQIIGGRIAGAEKAQVANEIGNIRAGFRWAVERGDVQAVHAYAPGLTALVPQNDWSDLFLRAVRTLRREAPGPEMDIAIGHLLHQAGKARYHIGFQEEGRAEIRESLALLEQAGTAAESHLHEANLAAANTFALGSDYDYAPLIRAAREHFRSDYKLRSVLVVAGTYARAEGELEQAERHFRELLALAEPLYERRWLADAHFGLGLAAEDGGAYPEAIGQMKKSVLLYAEIDFSYMAGIVHKHLGMLHFVSKQYKNALHHFQEYLAQFKRIGVPWRVVEAHLQLGETMLAMGSLDEGEQHYARAREIYGGAEAGHIAGYLPGDLAWLEIKRGDHPAAIARFLAVLETGGTEFSKNAIPHAMARAVPLLEAYGYAGLARKIAARVVAKRPRMQVNTRQPAMEILARLKLDEGEQAHDALLAQVRGSPLKSLRDEFEEAVIALRQQA